MDSTPTTNLTACTQCDLLLRRAETPPNHTTSCPRCGYVLGRNHSGSIDKTLALAITGLLLYLPAILLPLITLEKLGMSEKANVIDTIIRFYNSGYYFVSAMTLFSAVIMPACLLGLVFTVTLQLKTGSASRKTARLFRRYAHLEEWAMLEVYLFGILVTIFKMADNADVIYNAGFFSFIGLVFITLGIGVVMDKNLFWDLLNFEVTPLPDVARKVAHSSSPDIEITATRAGLATCLTCNKLEPLDTNDIPPVRCSRCGERLHLRKPHSISRTFALVLASALLLVPANILPIMRVDFLGISENSTILDGILHFLEDGSYLIGIIIMVASILVPLFKITGLGILLWSTSHKLPLFLKQKAKMFRVISFIGRWSMLDIFVIALLISLVDFGFFTSIHAAPASTFFCLVVAATMLAANTFDPRIMWDNCRPPDNNESL